MNRKQIRKNGVDNGLNREKDTMKLTLDKQNCIGVKNRRIAFFIKTSALCPKQILNYSCFFRIHKGVCFESSREIIHLQML
mgnify:CR=1 FL=1